MQSFGRPRQYVSAARLYAMFPLLRFSYERGAYVLRFVGESKGPVLRKDRRRGQHKFSGADRRVGAVNPALASRPNGGVRRIDATEAARRAAEGATSPTRVPNTKRSRAEQAQATRRRRQDGRQRPPRPHR
jgi:hypothetical protein